MVDLDFLNRLANLDHLFRQAEPICDWAEENVIVRVSNRAGRLRLDPPQRGMLEAVADPEVRQVTKMLSSQLGKTLMDTVEMAWVVDQCPAPMMFMHASQQGLDKFIREKLEPILSGCDSLNDKIYRNQRGKIPPDGFAFEGNGYCTLTTARSISSKHGTSAEWLWADEIDDYMGAVLVSSLRQRLITFAGSKLIVSSTPTLHGYSQIEEEFLDGSQSMWYAKCVHCDHEDILRWENVKGENYVCPNGCIWSEQDRLQSISRGYWFETNPNVSHKSFWMSQLYSYNVSLAKTVFDSKNYSKQEFFTQVLAWPFEEVEIPEADRSRIQRLESAPFEVSHVAVGVDVQKNRIEYAVWEYDSDLERKHLRAWDTILRSTAEITFSNLRRVLTPFRPQRIGVDGGYDYDWVALGIQRAFPDALLLRNPPIEIMRGYSQDSFGKPLRGAKGHGYIWAATDEAKCIIYSDIIAGKVSFNFDVPLEAEEQLTSERLIRTELNGRLKRNWRVIDGRRNELLDMSVYSNVTILGLDRAPVGPKITVGKIADSDEN